MGSYPNEEWLNTWISPPISINLSKRAIREGFIPTSLRVISEFFEIKAATIKNAEEEKSPGISRFWEVNYSVSFNFVSFSE